MGAVAARCAAEAGARVLLVEQRPSIGRPTACTGLVSPRTLDALGVSPASVLRQIRSVEGFAPGGQHIVLASEQGKALVLDRARLEKELIDRAREAGADVRYGVKAIGHDPSGILVSRGDGPEAITARVTVVATGVDEAFSGAANLPLPPRVCVAAQAVLAHAAEHADRVSVFLGSKVAPGFFGWAVPAGEGELRVGLAVSPGDDPSRRLRRLLAERFPNAPVRSLHAGRIPITPVEHPVADGMLLVGDAAGQVKPLSGGGLYTGAICARVAGRTAARAALANRVDHRGLASYATACDRAIGGEMRFGLAARTLLESLDDAAIDDAFEVVDDPRLLSFLARVGDIDRLRMLPRAFASERALWRRLLPLLSLLDRHLNGPGSSDPVATSLPGNL